MNDDEFIQNFTCYLFWPRSYDFSGNRVLAPRFSRDVDALRTWSTDIRQILAADPIRLPTEVVVGGRVFEQQRTVRIEAVRDAQPLLTIDYGSSPNRDIRSFHHAGRRILIQPAPPVRDPATERRRRQFLAGTS